MLRKGDEKELYQPWMFKKPPLYIRSERVVSLMGKGGAVLAKLMVAFWDVHVPVPVQSDSVVRSGQQIHELLNCVFYWTVYLGMCSAA